MVGAVLEQAGLDPSYLIGGDLNESGSGARSGSGDLFVFEADESDGSFLLVASVRRRHHERRGRPPRLLYGGPRADRSGVRRLRLSKRVCGGLRGRRRRSPGPRDRRCRRHHLRRGAWERPPACRSMRWDRQGLDGSVRSDREGLTPVHLQIDGAHNLLERRGGGRRRRCVRCRSRGRRGGAGTFGGVHRRFEHRGTARGADFFDDYGHTPTEMAVTIETARRREPARLIALVQPHRYTRVQALWRELGASVADADLVLVTDVYGATPGTDPRRDGSAGGGRGAGRVSRRPRSCTCRTAVTWWVTSIARSAPEISW